MDIQHRDGIPWYRARLPRRWHRCRPQTYATMDDGLYVERCACGAIRMTPKSYDWVTTPGGPRWTWRNSRKRDRS